jgi:hypothetical protein
MPATVNTPPMIAHSETSNCVSVLGVQYNDIDTHTYVHVHLGEFHQQRREIVLYEYTRQTVAEAGTNEFVLSTHRELMRQ